SVRDRPASADVTIVTSSSHEPWRCGRGLSRGATAPSPAYAGLGGRYAASGPDWEGVFAVVPPAAFAAAGGSLSGGILRLLGLPSSPGPDQHNPARRPRHPNKTARRGCAGTACQAH